jgi:hypothetical protein
LYRKDSLASKGAKRKVRKEERAFIKKLSHKKGPRDVKRLNRKTLYNMSGNE